MPLFTLVGHDGPEGLERRKIHREAHLAGLNQLVQEGRLHFAGPIINGAGDPMGSVVLFEAENLEAARQIVENDPYFVQEIFTRYELYETKKSLP